MASIKINLNVTPNDVKFNLNIHYLDEASEHILLSLTQEDFTLVGDELFYTFNTVEEMSPLTFKFTGPYIEAHSETLDITTGETEYDINVELTSTEVLLHCTRNPESDMEGHESYIDENTCYDVTDDLGASFDILEYIYPVGSIYLTTNDVCPISALFGTWQLVGQDKVLQGAGLRGAVGTTINESLPNITGRIGIQLDGGGCYPDHSDTYSSNGAFEDEYGSSDVGSELNQATRPNSLFYTSFNASRSSSTYQDNAPVQQDAYLVNIFRRIS